MGFNYEVVAYRPFDELLSDIGHSGAIDRLREECERMIEENLESQHLWALSRAKGSYMLALVMRDEGDVVISYFLAFPLEEMEALYWIADDGEIAELEEELEEMLGDDSIDWVGGHLGAAAGPLILRTERTFGERDLPEILVGVKIREERAVRMN